MGSDQPAGSYWSQLLQVTLTAGLGSELALSVIVAVAAGDNSRIGAVALVVTINQFAEGSCSIEVHGVRTQSGCD